MSVAGASLVVGIGLVATALVAWISVRVAPRAMGWPREHLTALADWALVALTLHALALIVDGTTSPGAYGLTVVLASAAAWLRLPTTAPDRSPAAEPQPEPEPQPAEPVRAAPRRTLWSDHGQRFGA